MLPRSALLPALAPRVVVVALGLAFVLAASGCEREGRAGTEASAPVVSAEAIDVRVASVNVWVLPIGARDLDERFPRMAPGIDALAPDVLCLQEMWASSKRDELAEALADRLPHVANGGGGLALLSRWPIREHAFVRFADHEALSLAERLGRKGYLSALIDTPAGPLRVIDTHLVHGRGSNAARDAQLAAVLAEARAEDDAPVVLCADLNFRAIEGNAPSASFAALLDAGLRDAAGTAPGEDGRWARRVGTRAGWPRAGRLARSDPDYIMVKDGAAAHLEVRGFAKGLHTPETAVSDHDLLLADLRLVASAPAAASGSTRGAGPSGLSTSPHK